MIWQDIVVGICNLLLAYAIVPEVYHNFKRKKPSVTYQTSLITFLCLYIVCFAFISLKLFFAATVDFITATLWLVLFIQRIVYK